MNRKSPETACFYARDRPVVRGSRDLRPLPTTTSPWGPDSQHGGPPAALLGRALERLDERRSSAGSRWSCWGPVPMGPARGLGRGGPARTVGAAGRRRAVRRGARPARWRRRRRGCSRRRPTGRHRTGSRRPARRRTARPAGSRRAGAAATSTPSSWRWVAGAVIEPGRSAGLDAHSRPGGRRARSHRCSGCSRAPTRRPARARCSTRGTGRSSNTELTVHVLRPAEGEWLLLDAETTLSTGSVGLATAAIFDTPRAGREVQPGPAGAAPPRSVLNPRPGSGLLELVGQLEQGRLATGTGPEHHPLRQPGRRGRERQADRRVTGGVLERGERHPVAAADPSPCRSRPWAPGGRASGVSVASVGVSTTSYSSKNVRDHRLLRFSRAIATGRRCRCRRECFARPWVRLSSCPGSQERPKVRRPVRIMNSASSDQ